MSPKSLREGFPGRMRPACGKELRPVDRRQPDDSDIFSESRHRRVSWEASRQARSTGNGNPALRDGTSPGEHLPRRNILPAIHRRLPDHCRTKRVQTPPATSMPQGQRGIRPGTASDVRGKSCSWIKYIDISGKKSNIANHRPAPAKSTPAALPIQNASLPHSGVDNEITLCEDAPSLPGPIAQLVRAAGS